MILDVVKLAIPLAQLMTEKTVAQILESEKDKIMHAQKMANGEIEYQSIGVQDNQTD